MPSFEHSVECEVPASAMWGVLMKKGKILPKIMPEMVTSSEVLEGDGISVGSVHHVKYGSGVPRGGGLHPHGAGFHKEKVLSVDPEGYSGVSEQTHGGHLAHFGFTKWVQKMKVTSTGDNTSKVLVITEIEGGSEEGVAQATKATKTGLTHTLKVLEKYAKSSS